MYKVSYVVGHGSMVHGELVVGAEQIKSLNFNTYSYIQDVVDLLYSRGFQYFPITYKKMFRGY